MGRPADKGCVEDLGIIKLEGKREKAGYTSTTYVGPFGMVVLELALEGDGSHEVLSDDGLVC